MDTNQVNIWLSLNAANFATEALPAVKSKLEQIDKSQMMYLQTAEYKKPSTIFLIALFLGWERFFLDDIGLGVVKVITCYGCGIWWLIDIFTAKNRARKYNFRQFQQATAMIGGGTGAPTFSAVNAAVPGTQQTATQPQQYNNAVTTKQSKSSSGGKIVLIIVAIGVLAGGGLFAYRNWDSWFAPDTSDIINMYQNQMNSLSNPVGSSSLEDIFSNAKKAKSEEKETVKTVQETTAQPESTNSNSTASRTNSGSNNSDYTLDTYLLTESDLQGMSKQELRILRNEIYARHGRKFKSEDLQVYFSAQSWYQPLYDEVQLNSIEKKNVEFIQKHE